MNHKLSSIWFASLFFVGAFPSLSLTARAQTAPAQTAPAAKDPAAKEEKLPSADELSEKCAKGSGGKEAWAKLKTMVLTGTIEIPTYNVTGKIEVSAKRPNKVLRVTSVMDGQYVEKEAFDGQAGWKSDPQKGLKALSGEELEQAKIEAVFDTDVRLKEVHPDMKVTGRTKVGDRDAYTVVAHEPGGRTLTLYLDAQTGLRIAEDSEGPDESGNAAKTSIFLEDYRAAGGIQVPYRIRVNTPAVNVVMKIQDVNLNTPVDDAIFAMPAATPTTPASAPPQ